MIVVKYWRVKRIELLKSFERRLPPEITALSSLRYTQLLSPHSQPRHSIAKYLSKSTELSDIDADLEKARQKE